MRRVQERTVRRRAAVLDAAAGLMTEAGFTAVTHRAVAARAGVPLAATTYHFATRDDLLQQAFALLVERELAHLADLVERMITRYIGHSDYRADERLDGSLDDRANGHSDDRANGPLNDRASERSNGQSDGHSDGHSSDRAGERADGHLDGSARSPARGRARSGARTRGRSGDLGVLAGLLARAYAGERGRQLGLWELYLQAGRDPGLQHIARAWTDGCDAIVARVLTRTGLPAGEEQVRFVSTVLSGLWLEQIVEDRPEAAERTRAVVTRALQSLT